LLCFSTTKL